MNILELHLTEKQQKLLKLLLEESKPIHVFTVEETQHRIAKELGITRQALNVHLRKLREAGLIRTGRGFIDLTERALKILNIKSADVFVLIKVHPTYREKVYFEIKKLPAIKLYRVTGEIDLIAVINQSNLNDFLRKISRIEGVRETITHVVIEVLK